MMILMILAAVAPANNDALIACRDAIHQLGVVAPQTILNACPSPAPDPDRMWGEEAANPSCAEPMTFAQRAARMSTGLPPVMLKGMVAEFDRKLEICYRPQPPVSPAADRREGDRLWK